MLMIAMRATRHGVKSIPNETTATAHPVSATVRLPVAFRAFNFNIFHLSIAQGIRCVSQK
jgi:hypothetical protein